MAPLLMLSGCMKFNASYDIKDEEHVNANLTIAVSKSMAEMSGQNTGGELKECEQLMSASGVTDKAVAKKYDSRQCPSTSRRIAGLDTEVSETWKVMPRLKAK